jgi:2-oxoglutarate-Fe(II)-dependent oxygenase superfamily protein
MPHIDYIIKEPNVTVVIIRDWLNDEYEARFFSHLQLYANWIPYQYNKNGKMVTLRRNIAIYGDGKVKNYPYNKIPFNIDSWNKPILPNITPPLGTSGSSENIIICNELKRIKDTFYTDKYIGPYLNNVSLNSCIVNEYKNGYETITHHSDDEITHPTVITVSLGTSRTFVLKHKMTKKLITTTLHKGDVLIMTGECQKLYTHAIPIDRDVKDTRISLTFRQI